MDEFPIERRTVSSPLGDFVCLAVSENEGDAVFPIPGIERIACELAGYRAFMGLAVEPRQYFHSSLMCRDYGLGDVVSFYGHRGRRIGYVFIEDGIATHAELDATVDGDRSAIQQDMLKASSVVYERGNGIQVQLESALAAIEADCLMHRAAAMRINAKEMEREAIILEEEARASAARGIAP